MSLVRALERYTRARPPPATAGHVRCELCAAKLAEEHPHVADLNDRKLCCVCGPCAMLFKGRREGRFRTVPDRVVADAAFRIEPSTWDKLGIPVRLAFFFYSSPQQRWQVAYPGPAGITEAELPAETWAPLAASPLLAGMVPDVEALLVYGPPGTAELQALMVPITACYELAGELRVRWRGIAGMEAQQATRRFMSELAVRSRPLRLAAGAQS